MTRIRRAALAAVALSAVAGPATAGSAQASPTIPAPPPIGSALSPQVAGVPGIASYLESSTPKTVEESGTTVVWVGTGNASWNGAGWSYPTDGATVAGSFEPIAGSSTAPASWPTESPAPAARTRGVMPDIQQQSPCANQDWCLYAESPYATYGFWQTGSEFLNIAHRTGYYTGKWTGYLQTNVGTDPTYGPGTTVTFVSPSVRTATFIDIES